jgi:hypothetical protein
MAMRAWTPVRIVLDIVALYGPVGPAEAVFSRRIRGSYERVRERLSWRESHHGKLLCRREALRTSPTPQP